MAQLLIDIFKRVMKNKNFALYRSGLKNDVSRIDYLQRFIRSFILESTSAKGIQAGGLKKGRGKIRKYLTSEKCGRNRSRIVKELYYNRSIKQLYAFIIIFRAKCKNIVHVFYYFMPNANIVRICFIISCKMPTQ